MEPYLEKYETKYNEMPLELWCMDVEAELWRIDIEEAEKSSVYRALRQQASMYEDQQQFHKHAKAYKKQRLNASNKVKK